jgi:hypothetical protein
MKVAQKNEIVSQNELPRQNETYQTMKWKWQVSRCWINQQHERASEKWKWKLPWEWKWRSCGEREYQ